MSESLRKLPSVDQILNAASVVPLLKRYRRDVLVDAVRDVLSRWRARLRAGAENPSRDELMESICADVLTHCGRWDRPSMRRVINATGVVLHTGLGRAPLATKAWETLCNAVRYANVEFDLRSGQRGERTSHVEALLCQLCGAEAVAVVNNNAAAVLIALSALSHGRQVLVSRGQLVEIGGSFRIPDVIESSGARIREVGTTNRTHVRDYERALDEHTGAILVVHPSNFRVRGFTAEVELEELAALARRAEVPLVYDLGGGVLEDLATWNLPAEPVVRDELSRGADLVTFSGDKILGGPQAGIIAGKRELVEAIRTHPLMRALRCDKLTYAALEGTLQLYRLRPDVLPDELPVLGMLVEPSEAILARARALAAAIETVCDWQVEVVESQAQAGSGALPLEELSSYAVALTPRRGSVDGLAQELRAAEVAVVGRIERERLLLDVRTIAAGEVDEVVSALRATRA